MANLPSTTSIQVESIVFPPTFKPPGATNALFLGGAGVRCMEIQGKIMKMTGLSLYLEDKAIPSLADKWKDKTAEELKDSIEFYGDIITESLQFFLHQHHGSPSTPSPSPLPPVVVAAAEAATKFGDYLSFRYNTTTTNNNNHSSTFVSSVARSMLPTRRRLQLDPSVTDLGINSELCWYKILAMRHPRRHVLAGYLSSLVVMTILSAAVGMAAPNLISQKLTKHITIVFDNEELAEVEAELDADIKSNGGTTKSNNKADDDLKKKNRPFLTQFFSPIFLKIERLNKVIDELVKEKDEEKERMNETMRNRMEKFESMLKVMAQGRQSSYG
ncbi:hypothetical protein QVD17_08260 [Tagetes erecta]|uniref:Chalcone-flavonone isomerase family protein n=1 Tax=Tagetes erecta TaxID=13708 RepID=A0AAD8P4G7_TARER|nr:hypothetical protein QVD17_08260 [Tagetes erecta]